jgi:hypothetical protein
MKSLGCRRFGRLLNEASDRDMTPRESAFLDRHRSRCAPCRMEEEAATASLNLLRGAIFDAEVAPSFDRRVVRRAQVALVRDSFRYWSPAALGGAVVAGLILAAIQAFTRPIAPGATPGIATRPGVEPSLAFDTRQLHLEPTRSSQ